MQSTKGLLFANNSSHFHDEDPQAEIEAVVETASEIVDKVEDTDSQGEADPGDSTLNTFSAPEGASELGKALTSNDAVESWAEGKVDIVKRRVAANTVSSSHGDTGTLQSTFEQASVPSGLEDQRRAYIARRAASSPVKTVVPTSETQSAGQDSLAEGTDFRSERPSSKCEEDDRGKGQRAGELTESSTESQKEGASGDTSCAVAVKRVIVVPTQTETTRTPNDDAHGDRVGQGEHADDQDQDEEDGHGADGDQDEGSQADTTIVTENENSRAYAEAIRKVFTVTEEQSKNTVVETRGTGRCKLRLVSKLASKGTKEGASDAKPSEPISGGIGTPSSDLTWRSRGQTAETTSGDAKPRWMTPNWRKGGHAEPRWMTGNWRRRQD